MRKQKSDCTLVETTEFIRGHGRIQPDDVRTEIRISKGEQGFVHVDAGDFKVVEFPYGTGSAMLEVASAKLVVL